MSHVQEADGVVTEVGYRGPQVCAIVGITYRQLDYWARTDLIRPSIADARGSGTQRQYSYQDLVELKVIKSLLDAGMALKKARRAIEYLRDHLGADVASASLVLNGADSVLLARDSGELVDLVRQGQGVFSIMALNGVKAELDAAITELHPDVVSDSEGNRDDARPATSAGAAGTG